MVASLTGKKQVGWALALDSLEYGVVTQPAVLMNAVVLFTLLL